MEKEFVVEKALCHCQFGTMPALLEVPNQKKGHINGKKRTATTLTLGRNVFPGCGFGICNKNPSFPIPCKAFVTRWSEGFSKFSICGGKPLTLSSKGSCTMGCPNCISIVNSGQISVPGIPQLKQATKEHQVDLNPLGNAGLTTHQLNLQNGISGSIINRKKKEENIYQVQKITISTLEEGSANDGSGTNTQEGMLHGKKYKLRVVQFKNDLQPENLNDIRWEFTYHNKNTVVIGGFSQKGKEVVFHCDDTDYCGQNISFTAYIGDKNEGAQLEVFHHNRFRWFDKEIVEKELNIRQYVPYKMDQGGSSLCGVAVVGYFWSKMCFKEYKKMILSLFQKGEACIHTTKFCLTIDQDEHLLKYKKTDRQYPKQSFDNNPIEEIDFIFLLTIRDYFNKIWDYEPDEENAGGFVEGGTGLTSPREIEKMFKKINGYKTVRDETNLITSKWGKTSELISELKSLYAEKYAIAMLINSDGFESNKKSLFSIPNHWVGLINIVDYPKTEEVECYVFTWGHIKKWRISYDVFKDSYYGYVSGK